jgi:drug/metabolite transporter (DMT)-like permease
LSLKKAVIVMSTGYMEKRRGFTHILSPKITGRLQIMLSAAGFGMMGLFAKTAYQSGIETTELLALRFLVAAAALWVYFLGFNRSAIRIGRRELLTCAALGLAGYGIFSSLAFKAFETAPASIVGMLFFSYPVFVILLDWLVLRQRPETQLIVGALTILGGIGVGVAGSLQSRPGPGLLFAVGSAAWYAAYVVATRRLLANTRPQTVALYVISFAALGFYLMGGPAAAVLLSMSVKAWVVVLAIGLISTVVAVLSFFSGLEKLGSSEASQIGTFELLVSLSLAAFVLGEHVSLSLMLGAALVLVGMVMGQLRLSPKTDDCPEEAPCH